MTNDGFGTYKTEWDYDVSETKSDDGYSSDTSEEFELGNSGLLPTKQIHQRLVLNERAFKKEFYKLCSEESLFDVKSYKEKLKKGANGEHIIDYPPFDSGLPLLPNFATASITYIPMGTGQKAHNKNIRLPASSGHTEKQILNYVKERKLVKAKYSDAQKVIIHIHSKLSSCDGKKWCSKTRKYIVKDKNAGCQKMFKDFEATKEHQAIHIRQTFDLQYRPSNKSYQPIKTKHIKEFQWREEYTSKEVMPDPYSHTNSFIVSDGGSPQVKEIIARTKQNLVADSDYNSLAKAFGAIDIGDTSNEDILTLSGQNNSAIEE